LALGRYSLSANRRWKRIHARIKKAALEGRLFWTKKRDNLKLPLAQTIHTTNGLAIGLQIGSAVRGGFRNSSG
jgi:hypothetical protein